jgi:antitoxin (DNA-binding transcriptional repressor) of toxin-antitoxin stability system
VQRVGLRELKNRLSHYVRQVRSGREIEVTDRGEVVAELRRPRRADGPRAGLDDLARRGLIRVGAPNDAALYRRMPRRLKRGELERLVADERGDR